MLSFTFIVFSVLIWWAIVNSLQHRLTTSKARSHCVRHHLHVHQETVNALVLGTRRKWPRPWRDPRDRLETETSRPRPQPWPGALLMVRLWRHRPLASPPQILGEGADAWSTLRSSISSRLAERNVMDAYCVLDHCRWSIIAVNDIDPFNPQQNRLTDWLAD